jgi:methylenetetrahydrofolate reductase (NADPH)
MRIIDTLVPGRPAYSFEFFPPKDDAGTELLFQTVAALRDYAPTYVSVTYGAGGSTRKLTLDLVERIKRETGIETMAHLTCVGATREEIGEVLGHLRENGIENVLALRGDPPKGSTAFEQTQGGFAHASELVPFVRAHGGFGVAAACYPEKHPEAESFEADLDNLATKVRGGVDFLVTQLFFDNADYFAFVDKARARGIACPIVPGIMPITNLSQIKRFADLCGAKIPKPLLEKLEATDGDLEAVAALGVEHAIAQCRDLVTRGAPGIHFYTLNRSPATKRILEAIR